MSAPLVDTHCHLDLEPLAGSVEAVLDRARRAGVQRCITIGTDLESSRANVALAKQHPMLWAAVGVHPSDAVSATDDVLAQIAALCEEPEVVAIGEVGLDYYRLPAMSANKQAGRHGECATAEAQERALRAFLTLAQRRNLPLLIHCRNAYDELLALLRREIKGSARGLMHCASGPPAFIEQALALGFYISFAGNVTFPNAHALRALIPLVPDERLLIETDAPFLAPQAVRGQPNEPAYVAHTAAYLAQLRGVTLGQLAELTSRNAQRLFGWPHLRPSLPERSERK